MAAVITSDQTVAGRQLHNLRTIASIVNASTDVAEVFDRIVSAVCLHTSWRYSVIFAIDRTAGVAEVVTRNDPREEHRASLPSRWPLETSPTFEVVNKKHPVIIPDALELPHYVEDGKRRGYRTIVILPLNATDARGRELVFQVHAQGRIEVSEHEIDFLSTIVHLAAIAVDKAKSFQAERDSSARLERTIELNATLLQQVLEGASMSTIAAVVGSVLHHPLLIADLVDDAIHVSRSPDASIVSERQWTGLLKGKLSQAIRRTIHSTEPTDFRTRTRLDFTAEGVPISCSAFVEPLKVDQEIVGGIFIFPKNDALDDFDILVAQEAKFALSAQLIRGHVAFRQTVSDLSDLFERLIEGNWTDPHILLARASRLGVNLSERSRLIMWQSDVAPRRDLDSTLSTLRAFDRIVKQQFPSASLAMIGSQYLVRVPCDAQGVAKRTAERLVTSVSKVANWSTMGKTRYVEGPIVNEIKDYRTAYQTCNRLLALARMFNRDGLVTETDFGSLALLISAFDESAVQTFVSKTIGAIRAYDQERNTELLKTAECFIEQGCRYAATAEHMAIHISTLRYRLARLQDVFSIDLRDADARFALGLALRLDAIKNPLA